MSLESCSRIAIVKMLETWGDCGRLWGRLWGRLHSHRKDAGDLQVHAVEVVDQRDDAEEARAKHKLEVLPVARLAERDTIAYGSLAIDFERHTRTSGLASERRLPARSPAADAAAREKCGREEVKIWLAPQPLGGSGLRAAHTPSPRTPSLPPLGRRKGSFYPDCYVCEKRCVSSSTPTR